LGCSPGVRGLGEADEKRYVDTTVEILPGLTREQYAKSREGVNKISKCPLQEVRPAHSTVEACESRGREGARRM